MNPISEPQPEPSHPRASANVLSPPTREQTTHEFAPHSAHAPYHVGVATPGPDDVADTSCSGRSIRGASLRVALTACFHGGPCSPTNARFLSGDYHHHVDCPAAQHRRLLDMDTSPRELSIFIAMLSGVILVVFLICYCCHRNMRKSANRNAQYWHDEPEVPLEVFTVDGQCYEVAGVFLSSESCASFDTFTCPETPSPPPAYEIVVNEDSKGKQAEVDVEKIDVTIEKIDENSGLPSYEAALRFEAHGYV